MFNNAINFNQDIGEWDVSKVTTISGIFESTKMFSQNISSWNLDKIEYCEYMFFKAEAFQNKYNSGETLPDYTEDIKLWLKKNSEKMKMIDVKDRHGKEIDDFFNNIYSTNRNELKLNDN